MKVIIVGYPHISIDIQITINDKNTTIVIHHLSSSISINCHQLTTKTSVIIINLSTYHRSAVKSCWKWGNQPVLVYSPKAKTTCCVFQPVVNQATNQAVIVHDLLPYNQAKAWDTIYDLSQPVANLIEHNMHGIQSTITWLPLMVVL